MMRQLFFLSEEQFEQARQVFAKLEVSDPNEANLFFRRFGSGNTRESIDRPAERFSHYESLLDQLAQDDKSRYDKVHKGTPFYFLAWTAFDLGNYEKALFYLDAAISEDIRADPNNWHKLPAGRFMMLDAQEHVAGHVTERIRDRVQSELTRFTNCSTESRIDMEQFVEGFCRPSLSEPRVRTVVSALYAFLLEFDDRYRELRLRSMGGGSMEPILVHLFKGGLCLESLLKHLYPEGDLGKENKTLGTVFKCHQFQEDFCRDEIDTSAASLNEILEHVRDCSMHTAFQTTARLRNTTGHNLEWDDIFENPDHYSALYIQEVNAILYVLSRKWPKR